MNQRPRNLSGRRLILTTLRFLGAVVRYALHRKTYPLFRIRSLWMLHRGKYLGTSKAVQFRGKLYGTTMRTPVWPSPAFDLMIANGGLNIVKELIHEKRQIDSVMLAITPRCMCHCPHCYESHNLSDRDTIPLDRWIETVRGLQRLGTSVIVLSGGEPMLRYDDLLRILRSVDRSRSDVHLHTTGSGVTPERAQELAEAGLIAAGIGLDFTNEERHDRFRGRRGAFRDAMQAVEAFVEAGVFVYTNVCLQRGDYDRHAILEYLEFAKKLGVGVVQFLEPKPCGSWQNKRPDDLITAAEQGSIASLVEEINADRRYRDHPLLSFIAPWESPDQLGCMMGGLSHFCVDSAGNVNPCVFVPVSFGNILEEDVSESVARMRNVIRGPLRTGCPARLLAATIAEHRGRTATVRVPYEAVAEEWEKTLG